MNTNEFKWILIASAIVCSVGLIGVSINEFQRYQCKIAGIQKGLVAADIDAICKK